MLIWKVQMKILCLVIIVYNYVNKLEQNNNIQHKPVVFMFLLDKI